MKEAEKDKARKSKRNNSKARNDKNEIRKGRVRKPRRARRNREEKKRKLYRKVASGKFREKKFVDGVREETANDRSKRLNPHLVYTVEWVDKEARELLRFFDKNKVNFFVKDFAISRGYPSSKFKEFAALSPAFEMALDMVNDLCESRLVHKMKGKALATFMLKHKFGYVSKVDVTSGGKPMAVACVLFGEKKEEEEEEEKI